MYILHRQLDEIVSKKSNDAVVSLLPFTSSPQYLLVGDKLPCHGGKIVNIPIESILNDLKRHVWIEGLYVMKKDLHKIKRYQNYDNSYKSDFSEPDFFKWITDIEKNTVICDMENNNVGKGIFVAPGKKLPKGTFIPSTGMIKLNPTQTELETKVHCSAFHDLDSHKRDIVGFIDPDKIGGVLDLINHAPENDELVNFKFKDSSIKKHVATANLGSLIKFYKGYSIMGLIVRKDIDGGKHGKQLLWSYATPFEYIHDVPNPGNKSIALFDDRDEYNGEILDKRNYTLKIINIFIDTGELMIRKVASLSRWTLMHSDPESQLVISTEDPYSSNQSEKIQSPVSLGYLQMHLKNNPAADRIIIDVPI